MMTLLRKNLSVIALVSAFVFTGCSLSQMVKMAQQQEIRVNPSPLELHGDSVAFEMTAILPVKMLKPNRLYTLKTAYNYGTEANFEKVEFADAEFPNQDVEQPKISQKFSFEYKDEMKDGKLMLSGVASNLEKTKFKKTVELEIAKGVITTSRLVRDSYKVYYAEHGYDNSEELIPLNVEFFFEKGSAKLTNTEIKSENAQKLDAFIASKNKTKTVTIIGSHSPEGLESINSKLSEDRAKVIRDYYYKKMKQYDYKNIADSIKFETKVIFQDWKPFLKAVDKDENLSSEEKSEIKSIVNAGGGSFEDIEDKLSKLSSYKKLTSSVYPTLRISKTEIISVKPKKTDAEIDALAQLIIKGSIKSDTLKYSELMFAASRTPLMEEKEKMYLAATKLKEDWRAPNNLGAIYVDKADKTKDASARKALIEKALVQFELASKKGENATIYNNIALCKMILGDKKASGEFYAKAEGAKPSAEVSKGIQAGKGSIAIRKGDYATAIASLGSATDVSHNAIFNLGLAQLLSKDFTAASATFEKDIFDDAKDALGFYCAAITAAKLKKIEESASKLKEAIAIDSSLRDKAMKDLEFIEYKENPVFTAALK